MEKGTTSLRRIFGLIVLFLFFEAAVAAATVLLAPDASVFAACALMTALALAVWVVATLLTRRAPASQPAPAAQPSLAAQPAPAGDPLTAEIRRLMVEANGRLAGMRAAPGGLRPQVNTLPLYVVVGPPGSGKTSAIVNSGLEPRLLAGEAFRDSRIVPTTCCNLWFAGGAIFADVSGHVFLDEPAGWESLLSALTGRGKGAFRRWIPQFGEARRNLRAIVLVYDGKNFLGSDGERLADDSRRVRERLQAAGSICRADFPVYTIFSDVDEIRHFGEFFAHLGEAEDQRTLGSTLPLPREKTGASEVYAEAASARLTTYFNRLCASIASKRMTMLARESLHARKGAIYEFPRELKRIRPELVQFLVDVFRPNPLERGPRLRGFYFTGVRQAAREMALAEIPGGASAAHAGSEATVFFGSRSRTTASTTTPPASHATVMRWAFLPELFLKVVLADQAAQLPAAGDRRLDLWRNIALGAAAALLLLLCMAWTVSWSGNSRLLDESADAIRNAPEATVGPPSIESLRQLDRLRASIEELQGYRDAGPPLGIRWGLYAGERALPPLRTVYFARFRRMFLDPVLGFSAAVFSQLQPSGTAIGYSDLYSRVKIYRTIAGGACRPDKPLLDRTLPAMLPWRDSLSPEQASLATAQIGFYTSELLRADPYRGQIAEDPAAVGKAQAYLAGFRGPDRLVRGLMDRVNSEHAALTPAQYAPNYRDVLSGPDRIEWAYSQEGREQVLKRIRANDFGAAGEACVVGMAAAASGVANLLPGDHSTSAAIEELYIKDFIQRWKEFLAGYSVLPYRDSQDAARKLAILSDGNRSPLLGLLFMVASNTNVETKQPAAPGSTVAGAADRVAERGLSRWFPRLERGRNAAREIAKAVPPPARHATLDDIAQAFQPVRAAVDPRNPDRYSGPSNAAYTAALAGLGDSLRALGRGGEGGPDVALWDAANNAEAKAVAGARQIEANLDRTPEAIDSDVKRLIEEPIDHVRAVLPANSGQLMAQPANAAAAKLCRDFDQMKKAYPLNPSSPVDLSIDALNRYFAPGTGELAQFVQQPPFAGLLQRQGRFWVQNPTAAQPRLSPQFLRMLFAETQLSELLYANGAAQPHFEYSVSLDASSHIPFDFSAGSQMARYTGFGSTVPMKFSWPDSGGAKLILRTALTVQAAGPGIWGVFRLLAKAQEHRGSMFMFNKLGFEGDSQLLEDADGKPVTLQVSVDAGTASPLFEGNFFSQMACTGKAAQ